MLRDALAHSQYDLVVANAWGDLLMLIAQIQSVVALSDAQVENHAEKSSKGFSGALW